MKIQLPARYGQRQSEWAATLLGYNTSSQYNIGMYGCLITSFACYINKTPLEVNTLLKENGGFTEKSGNFIWGKCTVLGLNQVYQSPYYSNPVTIQGIAKMKALLDEGRPLITHIDFDPSDNDDDQHWLIVYGYEGEETFFAHDPWSNQDITLDVYGGVKRCVYEWRAYDKVLPVAGQDALGIIKEWADAFRAICDKLRLEPNKDIVLTELDKMLKYEDLVRIKDQELTIKNQEISEANHRINEMLAELREIEQQNLLLKQKAEGYVKEITTLGTTVTKLTQEVEVLKQESPIEKYSAFQLIGMGFERLLKGA